MSKGATGRSVRRRAPADGNDLSAAFALTTGSRPEPSSSTCSSSGCPIFSLLTGGPCTAATAGSDGGTTGSSATPPVTAGASNANSSSAIRSAGDGPVERGCSAVANRCPFAATGSPSEGSAAVASRVWASGEDDLDDCLPAGDRGVIAGESSASDSEPGGASRAYSSSFDSNPGPAGASGACASIAISSFAKGSAAAGSTARGSAARCTTRSPTGGGGDTTGDRSATAPVAAGAFCAWDTTADASTVRGFGGVRAASPGAGAGTASGRSSTTGESTGASSA